MKDEVEWIDHAIRHVIGIGVDHVSVLDRHSSDGTESVLARQASEDRVTVRHLDPAFDWADVKDEVHRLLRVCEAKWVLFLDADEFPLPRTGRLHGCISAQPADVLVIDRLRSPGRARRRAPARIRPRSYRKLVLVTAPAPSPQSSSDPDAPWMRTKVGHKALMRLFGWTEIERTADTAIFEYRFDRPPARYVIPNGRNQVVKIAGTLDLRVPRGAIFTPVGTRTRRVPGEDILSPRRLHT